MRGLANPSAPPRPSLSVILITRNEEERLGRTLESVRWADEIIVVDSGSTDGTETIARRYTEHFHVREWHGFGAQKQLALELATGDWVLSIDADEVVTPELRASIERAVRDPGDAAGFRMELHTWFFDRWMDGRGWRKQWKVRLFRRDRARFRESQVHEGIELDGPHERLDGVLLHYHFRDLEHEVRKLNSYSDLAARQLHSSGARAGRATPLLRLASYFSKSYLLHGGFLYGRAGLVSAVLDGFYGFLKYAKLWELASAEPAADGEVEAGHTRPAQDSA